MRGRDWKDAPAELRELVDRPGFLTDRQRDVVKLEWLGFGQRQIALALDVSRPTVQEHRNAALRKIQRALESEERKERAA